MPLTSGKVKQDDKGNVVISDPAIRRFARQVEREAAEQKAREAAGEGR